MGLCFRHEVAVFRNTGGETQSKLRPPLGVVSLGICGLVQPGTSVHAKLAVERVVAVVATFNVKRLIVPHLLAMIPIHRPPYGTGLVEKIRDFFFGNKSVVAKVETAVKTIPHKVVVAAL